MEKKGSGVLKIRIAAAFFSAAFLFAVLTGVCPPAVSAEPACGAASAVVINGITREVLWAKEPDARRGMASTTKIMTALLLCEAGGLDRPVTVSAEAAATEGSSAGLAAGQTVTGRFLLAGMLLASGNDAATQTALTLGGSLPAFAEQMNRRAAAIGMENTHFVTPSGLDAEQHYSTAYDMALLAAEALGNRDLRAMAAAVSLTLADGEGKSHTFTNHNKLLTSYEGCIGLKTGYTRKSGRCLISAAERDGKRVIAVTLSDADDWNDHAALLDYGFSEIDTCEVTYRPADNSIPVVGSAVTLAELVVPERFLGIRAEQRDNVTTEVTVEPFLYAPARAGQKVGEVTYYYKERFVATDALYLGADADYADREAADAPFWRSLRLLFYLYQ